VLKEFWNSIKRAPDKEAQGETIDQLLDDLSAIVDRKILQYEKERGATFEMGSCRLFADEESSLRADIYLYFKKEGRWEEVSMTKKFPTSVLFPAEMGRLADEGMEFPIVHPNREEA